MNIDETLKCVKLLIDSKNYDGAKTLLEAISEENRTNEWYYFCGMVGANALDLNGANSTIENPPQNREILSDSLASHPEKAKQDDLIKEDTSQRCDSTSESFATQQPGTIRYSYREYYRLFRKEKWMDVAYLVILIVSMVVMIYDMTRALEGQTTYSMGALAVEAVGIIGTLIAAITFFFIKDWNVPLTVLILNVILSVLAAKYEATWNIGVLFIVGSIFLTRDLYKFRKEYDAYMAELYGTFF